MSRLPASRPAHARDAAFGDVWSLLGLGISMQVLAVWRSPLWRWLMIAVFGLLLLEVVVLALLLGSPLPLLLLLLFVMGLGLLVVVVVALQTIWRLLDSNRLILLAPDNGAVLDVVFKARHRIVLANHGRAFSAISAPGLRRAVADWVVGLRGYELDIRAQNRAVARHYIAQFPELEPSGRDGLGHIRLTPKS
ncbi:hypothetical protein ACFVWL_05395 [Microbacterium sp. NPDC058269]|uniref:hypothetical protein n=1 Tax=Microbacterium sp. NPDC058269 TaxID=3346414 RepID=UPI0036DA24AF